MKIEMRSVKDSGARLPWGDAATQGDGGVTLGGVDEEARAAFLQSLTEAPFNAAKELAVSTIPPEAGRSEQFPLKNNSKKKGKDL